MAENACPPLRFDLQHHNPMSLCLFSLELRADDMEALIEMSFGEKVEGNFEEESNSLKPRVIAASRSSLFVPGASLTCSTFSNGISSTSAEKKSESFSESALLDEEKLEDGVHSGDSLSSTPTGGETPNVIDLRKQQRKEPERHLEEKQ
uniref:Uncharacterized protein n=1 Tax=Salix viminalis TaxID=40686 RepID=A0A6N2L9C4_SALVM